jgi:adenylate kinase
MESVNEAATAENSLCEMLDAVEAGLLRLRRERDELRAALETGGKPAIAPKPQKAAKKAAKKTAAKKAAVKKAAKKTVAKAAKTVDSEPAKPAKPRQALGRTLLQIRAPRENPR